MNSTVFCCTVFLAVVACVYSQCLTSAICPNNGCCGVGRGLVGQCSNGRLGEFCAGRNSCPCVEGECDMLGSSRRGRCRRRSTTSAPETTTSPTETPEPTTNPTETPQPTTNPTDAPETTTNTPVAE